MGQPKLNIFDAEAVENVEGHDDHFDICRRGPRTDKLGAALPPFACLSSRFFETEDVSDIKEPGNLRLRHRLDVVARDGDGAVRAQDDPLTAPAIPIEEGIDLAQPARGERAGSRKEGQGLQRGGPYLFVAPREAGV